MWWSKRLKIAINCIFSKPNWCVNFIWCYFGLRLILNINLISFFVQKFNQFSSFLKFISKNLDHTKIIASLFLWHVENKNIFASNLCFQIVLINAPVSSDMLINLVILSQHTACEACVIFHSSTTQTNLILFKWPIKKTESVHYRIIP